MPLPQLSRPVRVAGPPSLSVPIEKFFEEGAVEDAWRSNSGKLVYGRFCAPFQLFDEIGCDQESGHVEAVLAVDADYSVRVGLLETPALFYKDFGRYQARVVVLWRVSQLQVLATAPGDDKLAVVFWAGQVDPEPDFQIDRKGRLEHLLRRELELLFHQVIVANSQRRFENVERVGNDGTR